MTVLFMYTETKSGQSKKTHLSSKIFIIFKPISAVNPLSLLLLDPVARFFFLLFKLKFTTRRQFYLPTCVIEAENILNREAALFADKYLKSHVISR